MDQGAMIDLEFDPASNYALDALAALFTRVYTGYFMPVQVDTAALQSMVALYDIDLGASRVALSSGDPIGLALLGVRGARGWIGGMGVVPNQRSRRVGRKMMQSMIQSARRADLRSIAVEVPTQNAAAIRLFEALDFRRVRTLATWQRESDATFPLPPQREARPLDAAACLAAFEGLHAEASPWQRDLPVLRRSSGLLHALGIVEDSGVAAYALYRMDGRRVAVLDAAAAPGQRVTSIESILRVLIRDRAGSPLRFADVPQDDPVSSAMHRIGADIELQQVEMRLEW